MADTLQGTVIPTSTLCIPSGMVGPPGQRITASASLVTAAPPPNPGQGQFWFDGTRFYVRDNAWVQVGRSLLATASRWQLRFNHAGCVWTSVAYGDGRFVVVSSSSPAPSGSYTVATSSDGMSWRFSMVGGNMTGPAWRSVGYGPGLFFAVSETGQGGNFSMSSPDGIIWTPRGSHGAVTGQQWRAVQFNPNDDHFLLVGASSTQAARTRIPISNPSDWSGAATSVGGVDYQALALGYPANHGVVTGQFGTVQYTTNFGTNFLGGATGVPGGDWSAVAYGNNRYVAVRSSAGAGNRAIVATGNGSAWASIAVPMQEWRGITYGNGVFVAVASSGGERVMTSPDGLTWTSHTCPLAPWSDVVFGNGLFVAVSSDGQIMTSR